MHIRNLKWKPSHIEVDICTSKLGTLCPHHLGNECKKANLIQVISEQASTQIFNLKNFDMDSEEVQVNLIKIHLGVVASCGLFDRPVVGDFNTSELMQRGCSLSSCTIF